MRALILSQAKCKRCGAVFGHADLGSSAYGEVVLSTDDGQQFLLASAWSAFAQRVSAAIPKHPTKSLWQVLAALADPVNGKPLIHAIVCPGCGGTELDYSEPAFPIEIHAAADPQWSTYERFRRGLRE